MYAKLASRIQIGWPHLHTADDLSHSTVNDRDAQDCINIFPPTLIGSSEELLLYLCARLYTSLCGDFNTCLQHVLPLQTLLKEKCFRILHPNNSPLHLHRSPLQSLAIGLSVVCSGTLSSLDRHVIIGFRSLEIIQRLCSSHVLLEELLDTKILQAILSSLKRENFWVSRSL